MEFKEISAINIVDSFAQEIGFEGSLYNIANDNGSGNNISPNVFPGKLEVIDVPSCDDLGEMDIERTRYLLNTDDLLEEILMQNT